MSAVTRFENGIRLFPVLVFALAACFLASCEDNAVVQPEVATVAACDTCTLDGCLLDVVMDRRGDEVTVDWRVCVKIPISSFSGHVAVEGDCSAIPTSIRSALVYAASPEYIFRSVFDEPQVAAFVAAFRLSVISVDPSTGVTTVVLNECREVDVPARP